MSVLQNAATPNPHATAQILDTLASLPLDGRGLAVLLAHVAASLRKGTLTTRISGTALAARLGVHRNTISSAYRGLVQAGVLEREAGVHLKSVTGSRLAGVVAALIGPLLTAPARAADQIPGRAGEGDTPLTVKAPVETRPPAATSPDRQASPDPLQARRAQINAAVTQVDRLSVEWHDSWRAAYARALCLNDPTSLPPAMQATLEPAVWQLVLTSIQRRPETPSPQPAARSPQPAPEPASAQDIEVSQRLDALARAGRLPAAVIPELHWSITRGELSGLRTADPVGVGVRLVLSGRWSRPRSMPPAWRSTAVAHTSQGAVMH